MSLDLTYRSAFERLWEAKSAIEVSNGQPEHAAAILSVFFSRAEERVHIFCKSLDASVYDNCDVLNAFEGAVRRNVRVEIIVQETPKPDSAFLKLATKLKEDCRNLVMLTDANSKVAPPEMNFAYVDQRAFRFEKDSSKMEAVVCAWNPKLVKVLEDFFGMIKSLVAPSNASPDLPTTSMAAR